MADLEGLVLVSDGFGYCKITAHTGAQIRIHFVGQAREAWYGVNVVAAQKDFKWRPMPIGLRCKVVERGTCTIAEASFEPVESSGVYEYLVVFDGVAGLTDRVTERELWPIPGSLAETPLTKLTGLQAAPVAHFRAREAFHQALRQVARESGGIGALASSRISILPHQAFVVSTVIDDPVWRYVLADEVGLGKTIEAGVIAHQLLASKSDARVLVLCPGPLARQWLCEMRMSFAGRDFRLLDLHDPSQVRLEKWRLVICSMKAAAREYDAAIRKIKWDLVVVDEAHHLLWNDAHYVVAYRLARAAPRLLLLSAVPARERETELLRLLELIDPMRYAERSQTATRFAQLYAAQAALGRRVRIVARQLERTEELDLEQLQEDIRKLLSLDVLRDDDDLRLMAQTAEQATGVEGALGLYRQLIDEVVSRYRLSRRILKNRRARLVDASLMANVGREVVVETYALSLLEEQIATLALDLMTPLADGKHPAAFQVLFCKLAQALCDPVALYDVGNALAAGGDNPTSGFDVNAALDYDEHDSLLEACGAAFAASVDDEALQRWLSLLRAAIEVQESGRVAALKLCLERLLDEGLSKVLIFAGPYGTAEFVADALVKVFGKVAVASFRHDLSDEDKETQVTRFRREASCSFLVSDESGGEGRNFQFADALVHYDLPWSVAAVEQRIGRLDRIGRDRPVRSHVICPSTGLEPAWLKCLSEGFGVFTRSISGLEFLLHTTEHQAILTAAGSGPGALLDSIPAIREACDRERASDDAEAITDAASFRSGRYTPAQEGQAEARMEAAVPAYLRVLGGGKAVKQVTDTKDLNLKTWRLRPEDIADYKLRGLEREGDNPLRDRYGTFSRKVARERADLEFFTVGHPVVDALAVAAREHVAGRSFTVQVVSDAVPAGRYMIASWRPARAQVTEFESMPEGATRWVGDRVVWTGLDMESADQVQPSAVQRLVDRICTDEASARDLTRDAALQVFQPEPGQWAATLKGLLDRTEASAKVLYDDRFRERDEHECSRLIAAAAEAIRAHPDEGRSSAEGLNATVEAIRAVRLELDVLALLKIDAPRKS